MLITCEWDGNKVYNVPVGVAHLLKLNSTWSALLVLWSRTRSKLSNIVKYIYTFFKNSKFSLPKLETLGFGFTPHLVLLICYFRDTRNQKKKKRKENGGIEKWSRLEHEVDAILIKSFTIMNLNYLFCTETPTKFG